MKCNIFSKFFAILSISWLCTGQTWAATSVTGVASLPPGGIGGNRALIGLGAVGTGLIDGGSVVTSTGDSFGTASYVGVDGGTGTLTVTGAGSALNMGAGNAIRIGANASGSNGAVGTVNVLSGGAITTNNQAFVLGVKSGGVAANRGTLNLNGGTVTVGGTGLFVGIGASSASGIINMTNGSTLNVTGIGRFGQDSADNRGEINITGTGNTFTVSGQTHMNFAGGSGRLYVESGNTVSFGQLILQGSDVGSGLPAPSGSGTIDIGITNWATLNPIAIATSLDLNTAGGSHLIVRSYAPPAPGSLTMGSMIPLITYASRSGSNFDTVGRYFSTSNGYGFTIGQNNTSTFLLVVPEPTRSLMAGLPLAFLLTRRRRK